MNKFHVIAGVAAAAGVAHLAAPADGAIVLDLDRVGSGPVHIGDFITARISVSTDNPNGIAALNARISTTLDAIGSANFDAGPPFRAALQPEDGTAGGPKAAATDFNPALSVPDSNIVTAPYAAATFALSGGFLQPTATNNNRPITGFTGQGPGGRGAPRFVSAGNAVQTYFADVTFRATELGTVFFGIAGSGTNTEYAAATGTTTQTALVTAAPGAGFAIDVIPVPEPTGLALAGLGSCAVLVRRRRRG